MIGIVARRARAALVIGVVLALAGCGGGGGSSADPAPVAGLALANVRVPALDQEVFEGNDPIQPVEILADVTGNLAALNGATVYVLIEDAEQIFATEAQLVLGPNGRDNRLTIGGRASNARVGDFRGALAINVCLDAACRQPFQGSPIRVPYHVKVVPGLKLARADAAALAASFPSGSPAWTSSVVLPQGASDFVSIIGLDSAGTNGADAFELAKGTDSVTLTGKPAPVGRYEASLYLAAVATTSTGRQVQLTMTQPISYTVAGPAQVQVVYSPPELGWTLRAMTNGYTEASWVDTLASDGVSYYVPGRIEYLPGDGVTTRDANGLAWLAQGAYGPGDRSGARRWGGYFSLSATACNLATSVCLAPGRYEALVYPGSGINTESPVPLRVSLTVSP